MATTQRYYWLGSDKTSSQDTFFLEALDNNLWSAGSADNWDTCWCIGMPDNDSFEQLSGTKTLNHIPGNSALTIKSELAKTLDNARAQVQGLAQAKRYDFFPETYSMPEDYFPFQAAAAANPDAMWIQKPKNLSRGRGIEMVQNPASVPLGHDWMIQQYLAKPHLYQQHKYVLRCYVLITSVEPLRCYLYQEGFAKLASATYSKEDLDNPYRHLTNPDINEDNTDVDTPVTFLSFAEYRQWLKDDGHDDDKLFASLKDLIALTIIAARESMRDECQNTGVTPQGCYELIGLDCMVDDDLKPWILECNLSPSLDTYANEGAGGDNEVTIKRQLLVDLVSTLGLNDSDSDREAFLALSPAQKAATERARSGSFECLFPTEHANDYLHCFPVPRYLDIATVPEDCDIDFSRINTTVNENSEHLFDDSLAIFSQNQQQLMLPNDIASWIWLQNAEGQSVAQMVDNLKQATPCPDNMTAGEFEQGLYQQVWDVLADWAKGSLFQQQPSTKAPSKNKLTNTSWHSTRHITISGVDITLRIACDIATDYLNTFLNHYTTQQQQNALHIDIVRSEYGYIIIHQSCIIETHCKLAELATTLLAAIAANTLKENHIALVSGNLISMGDKQILLTSLQAGIADAISYQWHLQANTKTHTTSRKIYLCNENAIAETTDHPIYLPMTGDFAIKTEQGNPHWLASEYNEVAYALVTNEDHKPTRVTVDAVVSIAVGSANISACTHAETIAHLWPCCSTHKENNANHLALWIQGVQGIKLECTNIDAALTLLSTLKVE